MRGIRIGPPKTSRQRIGATERQLFAINLRKQGLHYHDIAQQMSCSVGRAVELVQSGLRSMLRAPAEELRTLEYERLQEMMRAVWDRVKKGNLGAIGIALRISAQIAQLMGLNAPVKVEGSGMTLAQLILNVHEAIPPEEKQRVIDAEGKLSEELQRGGSGEVEAQEVVERSDPVRPG